MEGESIHLLITVHWNSGLSFPPKNIIMICNREEMWSISSMFGWDCTSFSMKEIKKTVI